MAWSRWHVRAIHKPCRELEAVASPILQSSFTGVKKLLSMQHAVRICSDNTQRTQIIHHCTPLEMRIHMSYEHKLKFGEIFQTVITLLFLDFRDSIQSKILFNTTVAIIICNDVWNLPTSSFVAFSVDCSHTAVFKHGLVMTWQLMCGGSFPWPCSVRTFPTFSFLWKTFDFFWACVFFNKIRYDRTWEKYITKSDRSGKTHQS